MTEPRFTEEFEKMKGEYEPLLPIERKLIWWTFAAGIILLAALVLLSRALV